MTKTASNATALKCIFVAIMEVSLTQQTMIQVAAKERRRVGRRLAVEMSGLWNGRSGVEIRDTKEDGGHAREMAACILPRSTEKGIEGMMLLQRA